jgi:hypothetical protein
MFLHHWGLVPLAFRVSTGHAWCFHGEKECNEFGMELRFSSVMVSWCEMVLQIKWLYANIMLLVRMVSVKLRGEYWIAICRSFTCTRGWR